MSLLYTLWCGLLILRATNGKVSLWCNILKSLVPWQLASLGHFKGFFRDFFIFYRSPVKIP